ncbi:MAG: alanyl-tRNA editing protein, partial [Gemmatimonadota bacterium]
MKSRRYYDDSYAIRFSAAIVEQTTLGDRPAVVLGQTYFYPTSGGQPHDTGRIGAARVVDVQIRASDGAVLHALDGETGAEAVECEIDWARRFDHMQQHTGQHILSQAFIRLADATTIGFHLGEEYVSIDIDNPDAAEREVAGAFALANEVIGRSLPVTAW